MVLDSLIKKRIELLIQESFTKGSGPGGQHVNKVSTAVELRIKIAEMPFSINIKERLKILAKSYLVTDDTILITRSEFRSREQNRISARNMLFSLIEKALVIPKKRKKTRPTQTSIIKRIEKKKRRKDIKNMRKKVI